MPELPAGTLLYWRVVGIGVNGTVTRLVVADAELPHARGTCSIARTATWTQPAAAGLGLQRRRISG